MSISIGSLVAIPWLIARIPHDYFAGPKAPPLPWAQAHPAWRLLLSGLKNALGLILVLIGLALLVLPGQGVLTLLVGLMLLEFPGKRRKTPKRRNHTELSGQGLELLDIKV
ncbi:MAG: hypothetical protein IIB43_03440 [Candidatus Marinimicrobia bacterium]|nr:hypothetical protein [Candidatus Neomarinimicrobiota bacterium]